MLPLQRMVVRSRFVKILHGQRDRDICTREREPALTTVPAPAMMIWRRRQSADRESAT